MANVNKVIFIGNLTRDPELRYTPSGTAVCNFDIAVNRAYTAQDGEKQREVLFMPVVVWGKQGESCGQYLAKGRPVYVEGHLQSRSWETKEGEKRSKIETVAERVQFLGGNGNGAGKGAATSQPEEPAPAEAEEVPF